MRYLYSMYALTRLRKGAKCLLTGIPLIAIIPNFALAAEWTTAIPGFNIHVHTASVSTVSHKGKKYVNIWTYHDFDRPAPMDGKVGRSIKVQRTIDCTEGKVTLKNASIYTGTGLSGERIEDHPFLTLSAIEPDSFDYGLQKKYCSFLGGLW